MQNEYRKVYLLTLIEDEGLSLKVALIQSIKAMGIKEFSSLVDMKPSNISRAIHAQDMKLNTFIKFLDAFGLELSAAEVDSKESA